jgi:caa(3)-type oxidase subunit IV
MADQHQGHDHGHHSGTPQVVVFLILLVLTGLSYYVSLPEMGLQGVVGMIVALSIATTKASLVVWFFMHLNEMKSFLIRAVLPMALLFLSIMILIMLSDTMARTTVPIHGEPEQAAMVPGAHGASHGEGAAHGAEH